MDLADACRYVASRFDYKPDKRSGLSRGRWKILSGSVMRGDCEDFSLTVIALHFGGVAGLVKAIITGAAAMHHVEARNGPHAVGSVGELWFDNWTMRPMPEAEFFVSTGHIYEHRRSAVFVIWKLLGPWAYLAIAVAIGAALYLLAGPA
jgi:hypothetical protein